MRRPPSFRQAPSLLPAVQADPLLKSYRFIRVRFASGWFGEGDFD